MKHAYIVLQSTHHLTCNKPITVVSILEFNLTIDTVILCSTLMAYLFLPKNLKAYVIDQSVNYGYHNSVL